MNIKNYEPCELIYKEGDKNEKGTLGGNAADRN